MARKLKSKSFYSTKRENANTFFEKKQNQSRKRKNDDLSDLPMDCSDVKGSNTADQHSRKSLCINQPVIWDVSTALAVEILQDMGVNMLEDDPSLDSYHEPESTPQSFINSQQRASCKAPYAPAAHSSINNQQVNTSLNSSFSGVADDFVLFRRSRLEGFLGKDRFSQISDEIILQIFKWLPKYVLARCAQVSKRWKRLAYDESLWKRIDLGKKHLQPGVLGKVIDRGVITMRLCMSEVKLPVFDSFSLLQKKYNFYRYSKLQYLDLSMITIPLEGLNEILSVCQQLRKLSLEHCQVNSEICCHIGLNTNLETLNMAMCEGLNAEGLQFILYGCRRLESWNLGWTHLSLDCIQLLAHSLPHSICHLNLSGCRQSLINEDIAMLVQKCPRLQTLDISDATVLTNEALDEIIKLESLEHLHVSRCYNISPAHYLCLKNMSSLCHLDVFGVLTDVATQSLRINLPHIEINRQLFSVIARPTTGIRRTSIWELRVRD